MIDIDGSEGEGGGQIVRTALGLSALTGRAFRLRNVRAGRAKPGLRKQHLCAVRAAARIASADVTGAAEGSLEICFRPNAPPAPGEYHFDIGSAGSTTLLLQTLLPALASASGPSKLTLVGGTHNPLAPTFEFLHETLLPLLGRMGFGVDAALDRAGFYPRGGGRLRLTITPCHEHTSLVLEQRAGPVGLSAAALSAGLARHVAEREIERLRKRLSLSQKQVAIRELDPGWGPGNYVLVRVASGHHGEVFSGIAERGVPAEKVANRVADEVERYLASDAPVGEHLADQLLLPMALAGGGRFRTGALTEHTRTQVRTMQHFLSVPIAIEPEPLGTHLVQVGAALS